MKNLSLRTVFLFLLGVSMLGLMAVQADEEKAAETEPEVEASAPAMILITPEDVAWGDVPPLLPPGAKIAVLEGNPFEEGPFSLRLMMPAGYKIPAHWHTMVERVTILSGTLYAGMGDKLDPEQSKAFPAGSFIYIPSKMNHFAWTDEDTVIQINGDGPFDITYIDPADDPSKVN